MVSIQCVKRIKRWCFNKNGAEKSTWVVSVFCLNYPYISVSCIRRVWPHITFPTLKAVLVYPGRNAAKVGWRKWRGIGLRSPTQFSDNNKENQFVIQIYSPACFFLFARFKHYTSSDISTIR